MPFICGNAYLLKCYFTQPKPKNKYAVCVCEEKPLFFLEKGNATAVILPIESYKKILAILEKFEDRKETKILSQSVEFKKLVKKGLEDIKLDRIKPWKEIWDEL